MADLIGPACLLIVRAPLPSRIDAEGWHAVLVSHSGGQMSYVSHPGIWLSRLTEGGVCRLAYREA